MCSDDRWYVSKLIKDITVSPERATKIKKIIKEATCAQKHTPLKALSIFVDADLSKRQCEIIQKANKAIYPCYSVLKKATNECYPKAESITITETSAEINLQDLLDHTISRLSIYLEEILEKCT